MKEAILGLLLKEKGRYLSGEEISDKLGVTRTSVWKHIKSLKKEGYVFESKPRLGYRLLERPDIISPEEIRLGLTTNFMGRNLFVYQEVSSTNEEAKKLAEKGEPEGTVVLAEVQKGGKGRMGRRWESHYGLSLCFSLILRPEYEPLYASQITFVGAVAVCSAIREYTGLPVSIKWPNDILLKGKKVCGILTELSAEVEKINYIVMGIGINVHQTREQFPEEIRDIATSLAQFPTELKGPIRRAELFQEIAKHYEEEYTSYLKEGFSAVLKKWRRLNCVLGKKVTVITKERTFGGLARDIAEDGCLLVETENGKIESIIAGDVSLRDERGGYFQED